MPEASEVIKRLQRCLKIDLNGLDECLVEQPQVFFEIAEEVAYAISRRDGFAAEIKEQRAIRREQLRQDILDSGGKPTEKALDALTDSDKVVLEVQTDARAAAQDVGRLEALREAFRQRSHALRDLVQLHLAGHYGNRNSEYDDAREKIAEKRRSRTRIDRDTKTEARDTKEQ